jgi:site-specific recombinase XerD
MLISEAFDLYLQDYIQMRGQSRRTAEQHEMTKRKLIEYISDKNVSDLTLDDVSSWFDNLCKGRCKNSVRVYILRLRAVLNYLNIRDIKCIKPQLVPVPKREATVPTFLSEEEVTAMIACAYNLRNAFIISLLYSSGIRLSELISLNRGQIQNRCFTVIGKGNKPRLCFID